MNIAELRLECLRLAVANNPQKSHLRQQEDAQHYLNWVMSPNITIELQAPVPDINVDPEYNEHLPKDIDNSPTRWASFLGLNGWVKDETQSGWAGSYWASRSGDVCLFWNTENWGIRQNIEKTTMPHFWDGKGSFPEWLAAEITKLQMPQEKEQETQSNPKQSLVSPEWTKIGGDGHRILVPEGDYRVVEAGGYFYSQRRGNGGWIEVEDNGTHIHAALVGAQLACERHRAKAKGSEGEQSETAAKPKPPMEPINFLKSVLPFGDTIREAPKEYCQKLPIDSVAYFDWRGLIYKFNQETSIIDLAPSVGMLSSNDASILMTALVRQAAKR